jgi:hypothetical protein
MLNAITDLGQGVFPKKLGRFCDGRFREARPKLANNSMVSYAIGSTGALTPVAGGVAATGNDSGPISAIGGIQ